jgi:hypothetical protein
MAFFTTAVADTAAPSDLAAATAARLTTSRAIAREVTRLSTLRYGKTEMPIQERNTKKTYRSVVGLERDKERKS